MVDTIQNSPQPTNMPPVHQGILHQTLGELLQNNKQAQNLIMNAMGLTPEKFQEMLKSTNNNPMMNQTIGELFKNGTMQQAAKQGGQVSPQQMQHIVNTLHSQNSQGEIIQPLPVDKTTPLTEQATAVSEKPSFIQKVKNLFT